MIKRYQRGSRSDCTMSRILGQTVNGVGSAKFNINKTARELVLTNKLHKVSADCCKYTKKVPFKKYEKQTGLKPITGIRKEESIQRNANYTSCLTKQGNFNPIFDFPTTVINDMYVYFNIEKPIIYNYIDRTGCAGCPYGRYTELELMLLPLNQRKAICNLFKESYEVKKIGYEFIEYDEAQILNKMLTHK